jgi:hypothetical protein
MNIKTLPVKTLEHAKFSMKPYVGEDTQGTEIQAQSHLLAGFLISATMGYDVEVLMAEALDSLSLAFKGELDEQ